MTVVSRRDFLVTAVGATGAAVWSSPATAQSAPEDVVAFCVIGDTHFLANKESPTEPDEVSVATNGGLVNVLNGLGTTEIPAAAGGGKVLAPRGVIHAGDVIDSGDKNGGGFAKMQETEWKTYQATFGLSGTEGKLKLPVYEVHGNHDGPQGIGVSIDGIRERNKTRPGVKHRSADGLHYSWDWGPVRFINLGIVVGSSGVTARKRRYNPLDSLDFLIADLAQAGDRPVVITHHIDIARYTGPCEPDAEPGAKEWDSCDVRAYYDALAKSRVAAIFYGHTHARNVFRWDGRGTKSETGTPVFNVDNSSHFGSDAQAFFYVEVHSDRVLVRECFTKDRWQHHDWTPQAWSMRV